MKKSIIFSFFILLFIPFSVSAHRSGCHRWHSCPSDSGSYTCGDTGYCSVCPDNQYCLNGQVKTLEQPKVEQPKPVEQQKKNNPPIENISVSIPLPQINVIATTTKIIATTTPSIATTTPAIIKKPAKIVKPVKKHIFYTSSYKTSKYYYCDTDATWKILTRKYLQSFSTEKELLKKYPKKKLHKACK